MKYYSIEFKWAMIFIFMGLLWMMGEKAAGLHDEHIDKQMLYTNLIAIPAIAIYIFALLEKKKKFYHGSIDFKEGLRAGLVMTVIIAILSPVSQYIISELISPDFFANVSNYAVEQKMFTPEQAADYFSLKSYMKQSVFGALVMGMLTSVIVAFFIKNKPVTPRV